MTAESALSDLKTVCATFGTWCDEARRIIDITILNSFWFHYTVGDDPAFRGPLRLLEGERGWPREVWVGRREQPGRLVGRILSYPASMIMMSAAVRPVAPRRRELSVEENEGNGHERQA